MSADPAELLVVLTDKENRPLLVEPIDSDTVERTENRNAYLASIGMLGSRHHVTPYVHKADLDAAMEELELARAVCEAARFVQPCERLESEQRHEELQAALARWKEFRSRG